jgi:exodeoxyribonuclease-3
MILGKTLPGSNDLFSKQNLEVRFSLTTVYSLNVQQFARSEGKAPRIEGLFDRIQADLPDFICLQEIGARPIPTFPVFHGYSVVSNQNSGIGTSGVAIFSRHNVSESNNAFCEHFECRGRFIEARVGHLHIASIYVPAPNDTRARRDARTQFVCCLRDYLSASKGLSSIVGVDMNLAFAPIDVPTKRWRTSEYSCGKGATELRNTLASSLTIDAWADSYRIAFPDRVRRTVWHNEAAFNSHDAGFAIDFQLISEPVRRKFISAALIKPDTWPLRFSDHAATIGRYDIDL